MKKTLSVFLTIILIISTVPIGIAVHATYVSESGTVDDCNWRLSGSSSSLSLYISGNGAISSFSNYTSTPWYGYGTITYVSVGSGITRVGAYAFDTSSITSVGLPATLEYIGPAFYSRGLRLTVSYHGCSNAWSNISGAQYNLSNAKISTSNCTGSWKTTKEPTCTTNGTESRTCNYCGTRTEIIPALGHTCNEWTIDTEPTCAEVGYKFGTCTVCGIKTEKEIPTIACNGEWIIDSEPSCIEDGLKIKTCEMCHTKQEEVIPATGHNMGIWLTDSLTSCNETTYTYQNCNNCSYSENTEATEKHFYVDGKCTTCDICTETVESEHNYAKETDVTTTITKENAVKLEITFSAETETEEKYDFINIYDGRDNLIGTYSGTQLASQTIYVDGDTVKIQLTSDTSSQKYGYYATVTPISNVGDLDDDAVVNATDLVWARTSLINSLIPAKGDLNGDCNFNLKDFVKLKKILAYTE